LTNILCNITDVLLTFQAVSEEPAVAFKAQPFPAQIFEAVVGVPDKTALPLTVPCSPCITKPAVQPAPAEPEVPAFKAAPVPDMSHPFEPKHNTVETVVQPFVRMEAYPDPAQTRARLLEEETAKLAAMREFHANPIRTDLVHVAPVETKPCTVPEPFNLESEKRHDEYVQIFQDKVERMTEEELALAASFKAQPVKKFAPYVAKKSTKPLTQVHLSMRMLSAWL
jgi:hypothetical protein